MRISTTALRTAGEGGNYPRDYTGPQRSHQEATEWVEKEVKGVSESRTLSTASLALLLARLDLEEANFG